MASDAHKLSIAKANVNPVAREWNAEDRADEIMRLCDIVASHMVSAREASFRRDADLARVHLGHAREALILALRESKGG